MGMNRRNFLGLVGSIALPVYAKNDRMTYIQCVDNARSIMHYEMDKRLYGVDDYWATPAETIAKGAGDCEDFAMLVNHFCRQQGINNCQLVVCRIVKTGELHVASVYNFGELLADTVMDEIMPMMFRRDLKILNIGTLTDDQLPPSKRVKNFG